MIIPNTGIQLTVPSETMTSTNVCTYFIENVRKYSFINFLNIVVLLYFIIFFDQISFKFHKLA